MNLSLRVCGAKLPLSHVPLSHSQGLQFMQDTTVLHTEVHAIKACVTKNINMDYYNINIYILSEGKLQ